MAKSTPTFRFQPSLIKFLRDVKKNNNRDWFKENKQRYEDDVRSPALEFIDALRVPFKKVSPHFTLVAKKTGGSLMRIYRDTRFSKDKTPYKTNVGIHVRHEFGKDVHAPGFYLHIEPKEVFIGAGVWHPENSVLKTIREAIDDDQSRWKRVSRSKKFTSVFELHGSSLKRPPRDFDADHPFIDDLKRKDHIGLSTMELDELYDRDLISNVVTKFAAAKPYVQFLCDAMKLPF